MNKAHEPQRHVIQTFFCLYAIHACQYTMNHMRRPQWPCHLDMHSLCPYRPSYIPNTCAQEDQTALDIVSVFEENYDGRCAEIAQKLREKGALNGREALILQQARDAARIDL
jgi:hypothetical protein